jgi:hypothetical protein
LDWVTAAAFGAAGGVVIEAISMWENLTRWQEARRKARATHHRPLPKLTGYIDPLADTLVALTRLVLGAAAGGLLHVQITGSIAAIAVGTSAPAILRQLGTARTVEEAVQRSAGGAAPHDQATLSPPLQSEAPSVSEVPSEQ